MVFSERLQKIYKTKKKSYFHAYDQLSQRKKLYCIFIQKNSKICVSMHFGFNNQFIKVTRTRPIFQKIPKNILFSFSIWDYEFICKMFDIKKVFFFILERLGFYPIR
jgi:hypothetical protein